MAIEGSKFNRKLAKTVGRSGLTPGLEQADKFIVEKGASPSAALGKKKTQERTARREKKETIARQQQSEDLRLAEVEDVLARTKLRGKTGGRRSLLAGGGGTATGGLLSRIGGLQPLLPR